jgi:hypothetical protein
MIREHGTDGMGGDAFGSTAPTIGNHSSGGWSPWLKPPGSRQPRGWPPGFLPRSPWLPA